MRAIAACEDSVSASTCWWLILFMSLRYVDTVWFARPPQYFLYEVQGFPCFIKRDTSPNSDRVNWVNSLLPHHVVYLDRLCWLLLWLYQWLLWTWGIWFHLCCWHRLQLEDQWSDLTFIFVRRWWPSYGLCIPLDDPCQWASLFVVHSGNLKKSEGYKDGVYLF